MKFPTKFLTLSFSILFLYSCSPDEPIKNGHLQFNFDNSANSGKTVSSETASVLVTITKLNGAMVHSMLKMPLFTFGSGFISESLELPVGDYLLTQFFILNSDDEITYACPVEGSEQAQYVDNPLSIQFEVTENGTTIVVPEVLAVTNDSSPESFGYVNFGFEIVIPEPDSLDENSIQLKYDNIIWKATFINQAIYVDDSKHLVITGRKIINESTRESFWIMIDNFELKSGAVPAANIKLQMVFNETPNTGTAFDSNWGTPKDVSVFITEYDAAHDLISGRFTGRVYNPANGTSKLITDGTFHKVKLTHQ